MLNPELNDDDLKRVRFFGLHPVRWEELKALLPQKAHVGQRELLFFGHNEGIGVVQNTNFPEDRIGFFDKDMVLIGWVQLGGDHGAGKKEGIIFGSDGGRVED